MTKPKSERLILGNPTESMSEAMLRGIVDGLIDEDETLPFINPDPVEWINQHYRIPETDDNRLQLGSYQEACLRQVLTRNEDGKFPYSMIVWSDIKKSAKSSVAAAVALWRAFNTPWGSIKIIANDLKQADSRVAFYIRRCIELNPAMKKIVNVKPSGYYMEFPNYARIEAIPVDPAGEAGGNDSMLVFSELWAANSEAAQRMWTELTISPMLYGESFRWVETYAGFSGESPLLEQLYIQGVKKGRKFDWADNFDPPLEVYENKPAQMFCLWNDTPRLPWQTRDYYSSEAATLLPSEFERVHRNQWVTSSNQFVPIEWWDSCRIRSDKMPPLREDEPVVVGVDAAVSGDSFAVVVVSGSEAGDKFYVRYAQAWRPPKGGKIDFSKPEEEIRRLVEKYNVVEVCYDEYQLADMAGRMKREMIARLFTFPQGKMRLLADKTLYDVIRRRGIHHTGEVDLREHIANANAKTESTWLRLVKRSDLLKIDLAVCLSMALYRAMHWQL